MQQAYQQMGFRTGAFPLTEEIAQTCLGLPMYPGIKEEQVLYVCEAIKRFFKGAGAGPG